MSQSEASVSSQDVIGPRLASLGDDYTRTARQMADSRKIPMLWGLIEFSKILFKETLQKDGNIAHISGAYDMFICLGAVNICICLLTDSLQPDEFDVMYTVGGRQSVEK